MKSLIKLEHSFQNYLLHANKEIYHHVIGTSKVPVDVRLDIYSYAYRARLHEALSLTYTALEHRLGADSFEKLCYAYIDAYPSSFRSIRWFGDQLPRYIKDHPTYRKSSYLAELAQFEWAMNTVFDAKDSEVIELKDMQSIQPEAWENLRFQIHPSVQRLDLMWNVVPIWEAITQQQPPKKPEKYAAMKPWILWRKGLVTQFVSLTEEEAWAIDVIIKQATFGEMCEGLCRWVDEEQVGLHAASLLKGWITSGLISNVLLE